MLAGGHTLREEEPKYGLAVVGTVDPDRIWTKAGAKAGDALYLTKPLGTGLLVHARADLTEAVRWMQELNAAAADLLRLFEPNAVTDVTGFGLIGHAFEVASRSGVALHMVGDRRNREYVGGALTIGGASEAQVAIAFDPQTAGGLLVSMPESRTQGLEQAAAERDLLLARIGSVEPGSGVVLD